MVYVHILLSVVYSQWLQNAAPCSSSTRFLFHLYKFVVNSY